jgi:hypothetical protein
MITALVAGIGVGFGAAVFRRPIATVQPLASDKMGGSGRELLI